MYSNLEKTKSELLEKGSGIREDIITLLKSTHDQEMQKSILWDVLQEKYSDEQVITAGLKDLLNNKIVQAKENSVSLSENYAQTISKIVRNTFKELNIPEFT